MTALKVAPRSHAKRPARTRAELKAQRERIRAMYGGTGPYPLRVVHCHGCDRVVVTQFLSLCWMCGASIGASDIDAKECCIECGRTPQRWTAFARLEFEELRKEGLR